MIIDLEQLGTDMKNRASIRRALIWILILVIGSSQAVLAQRPLQYSKEKPIWLDFDMAAIPEPAGDDGASMHVGGVKAAGGPGDQPGSRR